jgi:hypothetical protein
MKLTRFLVDGDTRDGLDRYDHECSRRPQWREYFEDSLENHDSVTTL